jgi:hypothetical protein
MSQDSFHLLGRRRRRDALARESVRHPRQWLSASLLTGLLVMAAAGALFIYLPTRSASKPG